MKKLRLNPEDTLRNLKSFAHILNLSEHTATFKGQKVENNAFCPHDGVT